VAQGELRERCYRTVAGFTKVAFAATEWGFAASMHWSYRMIDKFPHFSFEEVVVILLYVFFWLKARLKTRTLPKNLDTTITC